MTVSITSRFRQRLSIIVIAATALVSVERAVAVTFPADDGFVHQRDSKAAMLEPDLDGNGVRDDLDDFVQQHFGSDERAARTMRNFVISAHHAMITTTPQQSARVHPMYLHAIGCIKGLAEIEPSLNAYAFMELAERIGNTGFRQDAMREHLLRVDAMELNVQATPRFDTACMEPLGVADLRQVADK